MSRVERVILVGCVKTKNKGRYAAKDLYASSLFAKRRAYAEASGRQWFILSAEHGLVDPDQALDPYERTLNRMTASEREAWGRRVVTAIRERLCDLQTEKNLEIHAGSRYVDAIQDEIGDIGGSLTVPLAHLGLGTQLAWYGDHLQGSPVSDDANLRAVRLETWSAGDQDDSNSLRGTIEWTGDWRVTGTAGWLLDDYKAALPSGDSVRPVAPSEGIPYLYAIAFSLRATYTAVVLKDADGRTLPRDLVLSELESLGRSSRL